MAVHIFGPVLKPLMGHCGPFSVVFSVERLISEFPDCFEDFVDCLVGLEKNRVSGWMAVPDSSRRGWSEQLPICSGRAEIPKALKPMGEKRTTLVD